MDKNLKLELSALRNDVTTGLNNLQSLVQNIDTKLKQYEDLPESAETDNKDIIEKFLEASHWNDYEHEIFTTFWNKSRKRRIESLYPILSVLAGDISRMCPESIKVRNLEEADKAYQAMLRFDGAKNKIVDIIQNKDRSKLQHILEHDNENNFIEYYFWLNDLVDGILALKTQKVQPEGEPKTATEYYARIDRDEVNFLVNNVISLYGMLINQHEMEMYDLVVIDPTTFEAKTPPDDKLQHYRGYCLAKYNNDLTRAYEHVAKRK